MRRGLLLVSLLCFCNVKDVSFNFSVNRDNIVLSYYKHVLNMVLRPASNSFDFTKLCFTLLSHCFPSVHKTREVTAPKSHFMSTSERGLGPTSLINF